MVTVLVCLLIAYLFVDTVSRGNVHASIKGGAKGAAVHSARRGAEKAKGARQAHRERLASGAFLGKTRLKVGDTVRGAVAGPVKVLAEGAKLGAADERDRRRAIARGEAPPPTPRIPEPRLPWTRKRTAAAATVGAPSVQASVNAPSAPSVPTPPPTPSPTAPAPRVAPDGDAPTTPAAPAAGTTTTGGSTVSTPTIGVSVETVPGLLAAAEAWAAHGMQIVDGAEALGVTGQIVGNLVSAVELARAAAQEIRANLTPLIEAASAVNGADTVTVAALRQG